MKNGEREEGKEGDTCKEYRKEEGKEKVCKNEGKRSREDGREIRKKETREGEGR